MEVLLKLKPTPRFGQPNQPDFSTLLKEEIQKYNSNIKLDKKDHSILDDQKFEKILNLHEKFNSKKSKNISKELIERWFCDYPNKRLVLRNDYDQENSNKFLQEKEKAFEKLDLCDDLLLNNDSSNSN